MKEFERRLRKEGMAKFETKDGTKNVEVIELNDKDLKGKDSKDKNLKEKNLKNSNNEK